MIVVPATPSSIRVPMIQTGCMKSEFDSTYPIHLNGIISSEEYLQSIGNINRTISTNARLILAIIAGLCLLGGIALFMIGGITAGSRSGFPILVGIGIGAFVLGMLLMSVGCGIVQVRRTNLMREAIAQESRKYSMRSPTPCSWRLQVIRNWYARNRRVFYYLMIDIGHNPAAGYGNAMFNSNQGGPQPIFNSNQGGPQSTFYYQPQVNIPSAPPPAYPGGPAGFCTQCGAPRQDPMARFCPSCGQTFNKY